jgi:hypothetical protein
MRHAVSDGGVTTASVLWEGELRSELVMTCPLINTTTRRGRLASARTSESSLGRRFGFLPRLRLPEEFYRCRSMGAIFASKSFKVNRTLTIEFCSGPGVYLT